MKRILIFGMTENPGGIESVIMNYYRHIDREHIQFEFLCNSLKVAYEEEITALGGKIYKITSKKRNYFAFKRELDTFMRENAERYAAIWVNVCTLVNIDYLISAKKYGISRRIIHSHNAENDGGGVKKIRHSINKFRIGKYATDFWSCSEEAAIWFYQKSIFSSNKSKVIPNAIDLTRFNRDEPLRQRLRKEMGMEDKIVIGHVGRFHFQKNHHFLIDVFEELAGRNSRYHLLLVGKGNLENEIREMVGSKKLVEKVSFCGVRGDIENLYQVMDIFVFPSLVEGLSVAALEAQAYMMPCLLADSIPNTVKVNENVEFLSLNKKVGVWADEIERMLQIPRDNLVNKLSLSQYNIQKQTQRLERLLLEDE